MKLSAPCFLGIALLAGGCAPPLAGAWAGGMDCAGLPWVVNLSLDYQGANIFEGTGKQEREFSNPETDTVTEVSIEFSLELEVVNGGEAQDLGTTMTCTDERTIQYNTGRTDPRTVSEGCTPGRYDGYKVSWDGLNRLTLTGDDDCLAEVDRRGL